MFHNGNHSAISCHRLLKGYLLRGIPVIVVNVYDRCLIGLFIVALFLPDHRQFRFRDRDDQFLINMNNGTLIHQRGIHRNDIIQRNADLIGDTGQGIAFLHSINLLDLLLFG